MRPFALNPVRWIAAAILVALCLTAQAQQRKKLPRESSGVNFVEPGATGPEAATNRVVKAEKSENPDKSPVLRGLSSSVRAPFSPFSAADSFSGVMAPPVRRMPVGPINPKRAQELLDRRKNWGFLTPEELYGIKTPEEMLNLPEFGPDGELKERESAMERFRDRMNGNQSGVSSNQFGADALSGDAQEADSSEADKKDEKPVLSFLGKNSQDQGFATSLITPSLNQQVLSTPIMSGPGGGGLLGFGRPDAIEKPFVRSAAQEASMQEVKSLLESRSSVTFTPPVSLPPAPAPALPQPFSLGNPGQSLGGARSIIASPLNPSAGIGATLPALTSASTPAPETARRFTTPPSTAFEIPKRKF